MFLNWIKSVGDVENAEIKIVYLAGDQQTNFFVVATALAFGWIGSAAIVLVLIILIVKVVSIISSILRVILIVAVPFIFIALLLLLLLILIIVLVFTLHVVCKRKIEENSQYMISDQSRLMLHTATSH